MSLSNTHDYWANQAKSQGQEDQAREHRAKRREFMSRAWLGIPQDRPQLHTFLFTHTETFWNQRDELSPGDREFLLKMTERMVELFDKEAAAHDMHARALFLVDKRKEALDEVRKAIELDPANMTYQNRLRELGGG